MADMEDDGSSAVQEGWTWRGMWYEFTATTTFHGIHYITEATPYITRRLVWLLIVSGVTAGFVFVIVDRATKYGSHEKNVNVDVLYNASIKFPSVTICNQNYVRMSESYKQGTYNVISAYFSDNGRRIRDADENCRHRYVGRFGELLVQNQSNVHFLHFAEVILDSCRRLCSDLPQVNCYAFSFNKKTRECYISDVNMQLWEAKGINFSVEYNEDVATFHKYDCFSDDDIDDSGTTRIADGVVIPRNEKDKWEENPWTANYSQFLERTGHQKQDMIHSCVWQGKPCSADDFEMVMTDYGVCYSFNFFHPKKPSEPLTTTKTGSSLGLKLVINVEEYDYMPGPYHDAGIKMFLHDRKELPMVRDLGFAVPPGRHSLIDVRYSNLRNAEPPVGLCGEEPLQYFSNYTWFRCWRDCETQLIVKECGCIAPYMVSLTKQDDTPVCNMTHFFRCGRAAIESADAEASVCNCVEPCNRILYEPLASNAALSKLSIESILALKRDKLQDHYRQALNIRHRTKESRFLETTENLIDTEEKYNTFIRNIRNKTQTFEKSLIRPIVNSMSALIDIFEVDLNLIQFEGLEEAVETIALIYGPSRDTSYFVIERVIRNSKLVSLHTQNLVVNNFLYNRLESRILETIEYVNVAEKTLPRYNEMLLNVSSTMAAFNFSMDVFTFPPERLAKANKACTNDGNKFYEMLGTIRVLIQAILDDVVEYRETNNSLSALKHTQSTLRGLYIAINNLSKQYEHIKDACMEQFTNAVLDVVQLNQTYKQERAIAVDLDYTFDFDEQAKDVFDDRASFRATKEQYLNYASKTKQELQQSFTEELLNQKIAHARDLVVKIQFRLTERLRRRVDKTRADVYDWYDLLVYNADAVQEYMPYRFSEIRTRNLTIWKAPKAIVNLGDESKNEPRDNRAFFFTHSVNTSDWRRRDFHTEKAKNTISKIIDDYFMPINAAIDEFDDQLGLIEQELTTAIKQLRNLINELSKEEELTTSFVLRNFLQVDVYFSELRYQVIQQMEAYTVGDLMSDVGGYMGLLLGASVVTVFELLDVIIYGFILKIKQQAERGSKARREEKIAAKEAEANNPRSNYFNNVWESSDGKDNLAFHGSPKWLEEYGDMSKYKPYE